MKKNECTIASSGSVAFNFARKVCLPRTQLLLLPTTYYLLPTAYYLLLPRTQLLLLPTTYYLLPATYCLLLTAYCLLLSLLGAKSLGLTTH